MQKNKTYKTPKRETWVKQQLRSSSIKWPAKNEAERRSTTQRGFFLCNLCKVEYKKYKSVKGKREKNYNMDHIIPIMGLKQETRFADGSMDWNAYIERLLPEPEGYQALCIPCHDAKTATEDTFRSTFKRKNKNKLKK